MAFSLSVTEPFVVAQALDAYVPVARDDCLMADNDRCEASRRVLGQLGQLPVSLPGPH
jgi:hypothetical protein